jgi:hypothetical protein
VTEIYDRIAVLDELQLGKLPAQPARPQLRARRFLNTAALPDPPAQVDHLAAVRDWPMYGNDRYGDCVFAGIGHQEQQISRYGQGTEVRVSDADVLSGYSQVTGFNPNDPNTDQGTYVQDAMAWWRKTGIAGHRILSYASIDPTDTRLIRQCIALFGAVGIGFNFPRSAWEQFDEGQPWDVVPGSSLDGGHYVMVGGYAPASWWSVTWGALQEMTQAFWRAYVDEVWLVIDDEMANQLTGRTGFAGGVDLWTLGQDFTALTGEPSPIPAPPQPQLEPATPADRALRAALGDPWIDRNAVCARKQRQASRTWRAAKDWT